MVGPKVKFTVNDYMTAPPDKRYQLLDGELILAPSPTTRHQRILIRLSQAIHQFVEANGAGEVFVSPCDVVLSDYDVVQPDILFVSKERASLITEANIQGAPDLVVEVLSPATASYDRGYKQTLYGRYGVREYWLIDPDAELVEVLTGSEQGLVVHASYGPGEILTSPLLPELGISVREIFGQVK